jgi:hypothetical protein
MPGSHLAIDTTKSASLGAPERAQTCAAVMAARCGINDTRTADDGFENIYTPVWWNCVGTCQARARRGGTGPAALLERARGKWGPAWERPRPVVDRVVAPAGSCSLRQRAPRLVGAALV